MRDRTIIPTNLMDWPRVAILLPELKFILSIGFWGSRYANMVGVVEIPLRPLAASLGLDPSALQSGIRTLCHEELIVGDWDTYEFFVFDWFRFHKFKGVGIAMARQQFAKIRSVTVRNAVSNAAPWILEEPIVQSKQESKSPTAATKVTSASAEKIRIQRPSGIVTYLPTDPERAEEIEKRYGPQQISIAVEIVERSGKEPVPGLVQKEIERRIKRERGEQLRQENEVLANADQVSPSSQSRRDFKTLWRSMGKEVPR